MGAMEHLTIAVPVEVADRMRDRVAAGEFTDLEEAVREALHEFEAGHDVGHDPSFVAWFKQRIVPAIEANRRDPSRLLTIEQVRASLAAARAERATHA